MALGAVRIFPIRPGHVAPVNGDGGPWGKLRRLVGARPSGIVHFPTRRSRLDELTPGERLLIVRKYGGLGDILISSMLFPMLADQYPEVRVSYGCPRAFHPLFEGSGLDLVPYEEIWSGYDGHFHRGSVRPEILDRYDLIEDISIPCHVWENFFVAYGGIEPGSGLRWRNRLEMWAGWFGLRVERPRTNIVIREEERDAARRMLDLALGARRSALSVCLLSPFAANRTKSYPWFEELAARLSAAGWAVALLHQKRIPTGVPQLAGLSLREMGAMCAVADLILSVDTATFHWGGILGRPTIGIFNVNDGAAYCRYYPTARAVQTCDTPCINVRYGPGDGTCPKHAPEAPARLLHVGIAVSRCYGRSTLDRIMEAARAPFPRHAD
jgi:ADP-heptose:LPS heptosyltransferase